MTIDEAHQQYDDCMFCPGCSKLLTGLHMGSRCYTNWIPENSKPIIIGLAIAVIIGIVCLKLK